MEVLVSIFFSVTQSYTISNSICTQNYVFTFIGWLFESTIWYNTMFFKIPLFPHDVFVLRWTKITWATEKIDILWQYWMVPTFFHFCMRSAVRKSLGWSCSMECRGCESESIQQLFPLTRKIGESIVPLNSFLWLDKNRHLPFFSAAFFVMMRTKHEQSRQNLNITTGFSRNLKWIHLPARVFCLKSNWLPKHINSFEHVSFKTETILSTTIKKYFQYRSNKRSRIYATQKLICQIYCR